MANLVTIARVALLFVAIAFVYTGDAGATFIAALLSVLVIFGDALDGWVARTRGHPTLFGSIFDIAGDRIVENSFWVVFAHLSLVPIWVPLVMIARSFLVDAMRGLALSEGKTAFGEGTMMTSRLGRWLSSSRPSRAAYGAAKALVFCTVLLQLALERTGGISAPILTGLTWANYGLVYFVVAFGVLRGIMVLYDTREHILSS